MAKNASKGKITFQFDGSTIRQITTQPDGTWEHTDSMTATDLRSIPVGTYFRKIINGRVGKEIYVKDRGDKSGFRYYKSNDMNDERYAQPNRNVAIERNLKQSNAYSQKFGNYPNPSTQ